MAACDEHALVKGITGKITELVEANNPDGKTVGLGASQAKVQSFDIALTIKTRWESSWETFKGHRDPNGSARVADDKAGNDYLGKLSNDQVAAKGYIDALLAKVAKDPVGGIALPSGHLADTVGNAHFQEMCGTCRGRGDHHCNSCNGGRVQCTTCFGSGKSRCSKCSGSGSIWVSVQYTNGQYASSRRQVQCSQCYGSGKSGICYACSGSGKVNCSHCGGTARIPCRSCGQTGWFTYVGSAKISSIVERSLRVPADAPASFGPHLKTMGQDWYVANATYSLAGSRKENGIGHAIIRGAAPYARVNFTADGKAFAAEAIGTGGELLLLPPFLDGLLNESGRRIWRLGADAPAWFAETQRTGVLRYLFDRISRADQKAVSAVHQRAQGSVSTAFLEGVAESIKKNLRSIGRKEIRQTWAVGFTLAMVVLPLMAIFDLRDQLFAMFQLTQEQSQAAVVAVPWLVLLATYLVARLRWSVGAWNIFGRAPKEGPRHFWWLLPTGLAVTAVNVFLQSALYAQASGATVTTMSPLDRLVELAVNIGNAAWAAAPDVQYFPQPVAHLPYTQQDYIHSTLLLAGGLAALGLVTFGLNTALSWTYAKFFRCSYGMNGERGLKSPTARLLWFGAVVACAAGIYFMVDAGAILAAIAFGVPAVTGITASAVGFRRRAYISYIVPLKNVAALCTGLLAGVVMPMVLVHTYPWVGAAFDLLDPSGVPTAVKYAAMGVGMLGVLWMVIQVVFGQATPKISEEIAEDWAFDDGAQESSPQAAPTGRMIANLPADAFYAALVGHIEGMQGGDRALAEETAQKIMNEAHEICSASPYEKHFTFPAMPSSGAANANVVGVSTVPGDLGMIILDAAGKTVFRQKGEKGDKVTVNAFTAALPQAAAQDSAPAEA